MQDEEIRLKTFIESIVGGTVVELERQARWRKAWFVKVERAGETLALYARGDKGLDAEPYPGLQREANILMLLEAGGVPVPHVYGFCENPTAIIMDMAAGDRDVGKAANDAERRAVAEQYIEALAKMHSLDPGVFAAKDIIHPQTPAHIATAYLDANQHLYDRTKRGPEPMIEFALRWLRRNVPQQRAKAAFIHCDAGQFLFQNGKLNVLYDFEASHIGDPLADLAALRMRAPFEPIGADIPHLLRHYAALTGKSIDLPALSYHTAAFALTAVMSLAGLLCEPDKHTLQTEYLVWDLMTRRATLWALAECMGIAIEPSAAPAAAPSRDAIVIDVLEQILARVETRSDYDAFQLQTATTLTQWLRSLDAGGRIVADADLQRVADILGHTPRDWRQAALELEQFVLAAGPEHDEKLLRYFARQLEDRMAVAAASVRERLAGYALQPVRL